MSEGAAGIAEFAPLGSITECYASTRDIGKVQHHFIVVVTLIGILLCP